MDTTTQSWTLDTCGCIINEVFDKRTSPHTIVSRNFIRACPVHATTDAALSENHKKNKGRETVRSVTNERDEDITWEINEVTRDIIISLIPRDLTAGERTAISAELTGRGDTVLETRDNFVRFR